MHGDEALSLVVRQTLQQQRQIETYLQQHRLTTKGSDRDSHGIFGNLFGAKRTHSQCPYLSYHRTNVTCLRTLLGRWSTEARSSKRDAASFEMLIEKYKAAASNVDAVVRRILTISARVSISGRRGLTRFR